MTTLEKIIYETLGETSALFMSKDIKGTEIVMPTDELDLIAKETVIRIKDLLNKPLNFVVVSD
jgi:hypothetical protein